MVFGLSNKTAWKRVSGCRRSSGKAARARPVACDGKGVLRRGRGRSRCGGKRCCSNRAAAASAGDSVSVSGVLTGGEGRCWHACNRFGDVAVVKATPLIGGSSGSATSPGRMS